MGIKALLFIRLHWISHNHATRRKCYNKLESLTFSKQLTSFCPRGPNNPCCGDGGRGLAGLWRPPIAP